MFIIRGLIPDFNYPFIANSDQKISIFLDIIIEYVQSLEFAFLERPEFTDYREIQTIDNEHMCGGDSIEGGTEFREFDWANAGLFKFLGLEILGAQAIGVEIPKWNFLLIECANTIWGFPFDFGGQLRLALTFHHELIWQLILMVIHLINQK